MAQLLASQHLSVRLWARRAEVATQIRQQRQNRDYLPGLTLHPGVEPTSDLADAVANVDWTLWAVPSQRFRELLHTAAPHLPDVPLVIAAKGIETSSLMTMHEVVIDTLGPEAREQTLALSGPSFAREIVLGHPTAVVLACAREAVARRIGRLMFCDSFRAYPSTDVVGVEMGGALKNVIAIAAGGLVGLGLGENSHAALVTRGLAEINRMAVAKGADPLTLSGLAGMGDLVLTCAGTQSRNRSVGKAIGEGKSVRAALDSVHQVAEGVETARSAHALARQLGVEVPIIEAVYQVLYEDLPVRQALLNVVRRPPVKEF